MATSITDINWQALAAIATFFAVLIAFIPIYREAYRTRAQARSLRIRIGSQLSILRPSLGALVRGGMVSYPDAVLTKEAFTEAVRSLSIMMQESSVLECDEQDQLGAVFVNLHMAAVLYGTKELKADSAQHILQLIDKALNIMGNYGFLHGNVKKPREQKQS